MGDNFLKEFLTLFGIGAIVAWAKGIKSKKSFAEIVSDMIITGVFSIGATTIMILFPTVSPIAVIGLGAMGSVLGVAFVSQKIEDYVNKLTGKKDGQ